MKMLIKYCLIILPFAVNFGNLNAQVAVSHDDNWNLNSNKSDEFISSPINSSQWTIFEKNDHPWGGNYCFRDDLAYIESGELVLKVLVKYLEDEDCIYYPEGDYYSGGIISNSANYSYGYFEIEAKFPGKYINSLPNGKGFWPAFWTYYIEGPDNCRTIHDEIDIMDPGGLAYENASTMVSHWNDEYYTECDIVEGGGGKHESNEPLFDDYHKYAVEWLPDRIIFYFDDQPFGETYDDPKIEMEPQYVVIDQQMDENVPVSGSMTFPQYMKVKYFRYYEINIDSCNYNATILNNNQLSNFTFGVRRNITIGNGSSNISLSSNDRLTLRASNDIIINGEFMVPLGGELNLIPTPCF
jgi:beta-glucanase (GH16 family)